MQHSGLIQLKRSFELTHPSLKFISSQHDILAAMQFIEGH